MSSHRTCLTFDVDWAPDFVIDWVADKCIENATKATWFVTHTSPAVDRLRERPDIFELGIHPNFFPGSSHGNTIDGVLKTCMEIVPEAVSCRTHGYYGSSVHLNRLMTDTPILFDVSQFIPHSITPTPHQRFFKQHNLWRIPTIWGEGYEFHSPNPVWTIDQLPKYQGIGIIDLHPIHVYLNTQDISIYHKVKSLAPSLMDIDENMIENYRSTSSLGALAMFDSVRAQGAGVLVREIVGAQR